MAKFKIHVDLDASREEAEYLETIDIEADDEDEALEKADKIVKDGMFGGPYYNVREKDNEDEENDKEN